MQRMHGELPPAESLDENLGSTSSEPVSSAPPTKVGEKWKTRGVAGFLGELVASANSVPTLAAGCMAEDSEQGQVPDYLGRIGEGSGRVAADKRL